MHAYLDSGQDTDLAIAEHLSANWHAIQGFEAFGQI